MLFLSSIIEAEDGFDVAEYAYRISVRKSFGKG
jgi:hypothetical protein